MEWSMRKKGMPEAMVRSVMNLHVGAMTRIGVDSELSEEFDVKVGMHQESVLLPIIFAVVVDAVTEFASEGAPSELLYADDIVLMSKTIEEHRNKFLKWKDALESKGLNLEKIKVMVSGGITKDGMSKRKVDPCVVCSLRAKAN